MLHDVLIAAGLVWGIGLMIWALIRPECASARQRLGTRVGAWSGLVTAGCILLAEVGRSLEAHQTVSAALVAGFVLAALGSVLILSTAAGPFARATAAETSRGPVSKRAAVFAVVVLVLGDIAILASAELPGRAVAIASLAAGIAMVVASGLGLYQASLRSANGRG